MFKKVFNRRIAAILFGAGLLTGSATLAARPAGAAQTPSIPRRTTLQDFPADVQQVLNAVSAQLPADARMLGNNAIAALSADQVQEATVNIRTGVATFGLPAYISLAVTLDQIRQELPSNRQQAFVNGVWGVSPQERQFARMMIIAACIRSGAPHDKCLAVGASAVPTSTGARQTPLEGEQRPYPQGNAGRYDTLGGQIVFHDPQDRNYQATYPVASAPANASWWRCNEEYSVTPWTGNGSPGISCRQVFPSK